MSDVPCDEEGSSFMWDWVRIFEVIEADGSKSIRIDHSDDIEPWKITGMLQAAADFHRQLMTNVFFNVGWEEAWGDSEEE